MNSEDFQEDISALFANLPEVARKMADYVIEELSREERVEEGG